MYKCRRHFILQILPKSSSNKAKLIWPIQKAKPQRIWKTTRLCVLYRIILLPIEIGYLSLWGIKRGHKIITIIKYISWRLLGFLMCWGHWAESKTLICRFLSSQARWALYSPFPDPLLLHTSLKTISALHTWPHQTLLCTSEPNRATERVSEACFRLRRRFIQLQAQATMYFWRELTTPRGSGALLTSELLLLFLLNTTCWALTATTECPFRTNICTALGGTRCPSASNTWCSRPTTKSHIKLAISVMRVQILNTKRIISDAFINLSY